MSRKVAGMETEHSAAGMPRWVKVFGLVVLGLVVLLVALKFLGIGDHGPGRHLPGRDDPADHRPPPGLEHGTPP